jgi:hypothetical protein
MASVLRDFFELSTVHAENYIRRIRDMRNIAYWKGYFYFMHFEDGTGTLAQGYYISKTTSDLSVASTVEVTILLSGSAAYEKTYCTRFLQLNTAAGGLFNTIVCCALLIVNPTSTALEIVQGNCLDDGSVTWSKKGSTVGANEGFLYDIVAEYPTPGTNSLYHILQILNSGSTTVLYSNTRNQFAGDSLNSVVLDAAAAQKEKVIAGWWDRDNSEYHLIYPPSTIWKEYKYVPKPAGVTYVQDMIFAIPSSYDIRRSLFWYEVVDADIGKVKYFMFNLYYLYWYNYKEAEWNNYETTIASEVNCGLWTRTFLELYSIKIFAWNNALWKLTDQIVLKKFQAFEPRDYKKVYLTNKNESLTGVIQFQDRNGSDDLSGWTDADNTLSVSKEIVGHKNTLNFKTDAINEAVEYTVTTSTSGRLEFHIKLKQTNKNVYFQIYSSTYLCRIRFSSAGNIYFEGTAASGILDTYSIDIWYKIAIDYIQNSTCTLYKDNVSLGTVTGNNVNFTKIRIVDTTGSAEVEFDSFGLSEDSYVSNTIDKIQAYAGHGDTLDDAIIGAGQNLGGLSYKLLDYDEGTLFGLVTYEMFKATIASIIRTTDTFEDESMDLYNDLEQLLVTAKVDEDNNDGRFRHEIKLKPWNVDDYNTKNKITVTLIQYTYAAMYKYILDNFALHKKYGEGTNALVNIFTATQISGADTGWTNGDYSGGTSSYINKKSFLNGFMKDVLQQYDNGAGQAFLTYTLPGNYTVFSGWIASSDIAKEVKLEFYDSGGRITLLNIDSSLIQIYTSTGFQTVGTPVNNTKFHWAIVFLKSTNQMQVYISGSYVNIYTVNRAFTDDYITYIKYGTNSTDTGYYGWHSDLYKGNSIVQALNTCCSISPLLTTKYDFRIKNKTIGQIEKLIDDETGYVVSERPDGLTYIDQYAPSGLTINKDEDQGITYQSLMGDKRQKFSLIIGYGGYIEGKQITSRAFGEPNYGTYEFWRPSINGQDPNDIYYDANGNPKSYRLDNAVQEVITKRNKFLRTQEMGKKEVGLFYVGTSFTYSNAQFKISGETWNCWRKVIFNMNLKDCRMEIADSLYTPSDQDGYADPEARLTQGIESNSENIVNNQQGIGQLEENVNSADGQGITPAYGKVDSNNNYSANSEVESFTEDKIDGTASNWENSDGSSCVSSFQSSITLTNSVNNKSVAFKNVMQFFDNNAAAKCQVTHTINGIIFSGWFASSNITFDTQIQFYEDANRIGIIRIDTDEIRWYGGSTITIIENINNNTAYHYLLIFDVDNDKVDIYINGFKYPTQSIEHNITTQINKVIFGTSTGDSNYYGYHITHYAGTDFYDALSSLFDGSWNPKQLITQKISGAIKTDNILTAYIEENARNLDENIWGFFLSQTTASALSSGSPINTTVGCHRILIVVNAGSDVSGTLTITGTTRDREDTSNSTPANTEDIVIDGLSTDNSSTDAQGNTVHEFLNVFMSDNWFEGAITISTTDLNISDLDIYAILYHQFDDFYNIYLKTLNVTAKVTNASGWFYMYLYLIDCVNLNKKYNIENIVAHEITAAITVANKGYRRRKKIRRVINGNEGHGVWGELFFGPAAATYWQDISIYLTGMLDGEDPLLE